MNGESGASVWVTSMIGLLLAVFVVMVVVSVFEAVAPVWSGTHRLAVDIVAAIVAVIASFLWCLSNGQVTNSSGGGTGDEEETEWRALVNEEDSSRMDGDE